MDNKTLENQRVLIVDDQRAFQLMFKGILYSMGATNVAFAPTGEQALAKCAMASYDILFVDYHLGIGKNGKQLLEDLREKKLLPPHCIFMLVTGENSVPMVMSAVELEPDDYLVKPFSQSVLRSRIQRIQRKKTQLADLYQALFDDMPEKAIELCQQEVSQEGRYQQFCKRVLVENLIRLEQLDKAEHILTQALQQRRSGWALLLQAKIYFLQQRFADSLLLCEEAIADNRYFAEAYDIKAQCYQATDELDAALSSVLSAAEIAPFNMQRQYLLIDIARKLNNIPQQVQASKQLYEITRRSIKQDIVHLLNYIRSTIDAAVRTEDPSQRNRYLQEVSLAMQRVKRDESMTREINFELFEHLCQARLESLHGAQYQAKRTYAAVAEQLPEQHQLLPDTIFLLNQIGEYEQAATLGKLLPAELMRNPLLKTLFADQKSFLDQKQHKFGELNKSGIQSYKAGNFVVAVKQFESALELAPMNTGCALNLIQASIQLLHSQKKRKSTELFERCKKTFRIVDNMPLPEHHRARYKELLQQFDKLRDELRR
ncbi:MAG: response regulator [Gammaproteobacteria bacterium]|nr:response regulator [Gammaproteobacteria bacterium]MBU1553653.1 response regulator [Gammaproteobacteria bacterium]MBU2070156.1 response regulator [Gammaproteobacteria bacterium]MBU2183593.1 response regulator [Gammaproteobacteria bacterium]MBU2204744.1 response regulator [Gammaproteobacteria bacterium]